MSNFLSPPSSRTRKSMLSKKETRTIASNTKLHTPAQIFSPSGTNSTTNEPTTSFHVPKQPERRYSNTHTEDTIEVVTQTESDTESDDDLLQFVGIKSNRRISKVQRSNSANDLATPGKAKHTNKGSLSDINVKRNNISPPRSKRTADTASNSVGALPNMEGAGVASKNPGPVEPAASHAAGENGWTTVNGKKTRQSHAQEINSPVTRPSSGTGAIPKIVVNRHRLNSNNSQPTVSTTNTYMTDRRKNLPPIVIHKQYDGDMTQLNTAFRNQHSPMSYSCVLVKGGTEIRTSCYKDYVNLTKFLEKYKVPFHLIREEGRTMSIVIRGIPSNIRADTITEALQAKGYEILNIKNMQSPSGVPYPMFAVELPENERSKTIYDLTGLCYYTVVVEAYRSRDQILQCRNCQKFQHHTEMCRAMPRCRICSEPHRATDCRLPLGMPPCCANCHGEHTADSSACQIRKAVMKSIRQRNRRPQENKPPRRVVESPQVARENTLRRHTQPSPVMRADTVGERTGAREALRTREREVLAAENRDYSAALQRETRTREIRQQDRPEPPKGNDRTHRPSAEATPMTTKRQVQHTTNEQEPHPDTMEIRRIQHQLMQQQELLLRQTQQLKAGWQQLHEEQRALREQQRLWEARIQYPEGPTTPISNRQQACFSPVSHYDDRSESLSHNDANDLVPRLLDALKEAYEILKDRQDWRVLPMVVHRFTMRLLDLPNTHTKDTH